MCCSVFYFAGQMTVVKAETELLHSYDSSLGQEIINVIAVDKSKLRPLLPDGFDLRPADILGFGNPGQGIVAIANYNGINDKVDQKKPIKPNCNRCGDIGLMRES